MTHLATLVSLQVGLPRTVGNDGAAEVSDRTWTSGIWKEPVEGPRRVGITQIDGDGQADLDNHGGVHKAVLAYSASHYPYWRSELGEPVPFGGFGENLTLDGVTEDGVCIGDMIRVGSVTLQLSQPRQPCWKLARRWRRKDLAAQVERNGRTGWYYRVLEEGEMGAGDAVVLVDRPHPGWTVARANGVMHDRGADAADVEGLVALPELSPSWVSTLTQRLAGRAADPQLRREGTA